MTQSSDSEPLLNVARFRGGDGQHCCAYDTARDRPGIEKVGQLSATWRVGGNYVRKCTPL